MRNWFFVVLAAILAFTPVFAPATVEAADSAEVVSVGTVKFDKRLLAVGAGAVFGIVVFNMLTYPMGSVPFVAGPLAATPVDIALGSRFLAAMVGGGSALVAHYIYTASTAK